MSRVHTALAKAEATRAHGMGIALDQPTAAQLADEIVRKNAIIDRQAREAGDERMFRHIVCIYAAAVTVVAAWGWFW